MRAANSVAVPEVLAVSDEPPNHLVLEWIDEGRARPSTEQHLGVGVFEIVPGVFLLGLQKHVAVTHLLVVGAAVEVEIIDPVDALHVHGEPLEPVGELARHRRAFEAGDLLEISELRDLHAVAPAFPAEPPGAERRAFPVVFDETQVVHGRVG